ncbi:MAG: hypothetical protein AAF198_10320 [Pseudomonadota bacterium]
MRRLTFAILSLFVFVSPLLAQGGLSRGVGADQLSVGFSDAPDMLRYRITSRSLPAPMQVVFKIKSRSNGIEMRGQGVFEMDPPESEQLFQILSASMGERVRLVDGRVIFALSSLLDKDRRAIETAMFGISKWFQPNDCFAILGDCASFQETAQSAGRSITVRTSEANGVWRARAVINETEGELAYTSSYSVDAAGFLIDENRTEFFDGLKVRTTVRRLEADPS